MAGAQEEVFHPVGWRGVHFCGAGGAGGEAVLVMKVEIFFMIKFLYC